MTELPEGWAKVALAEVWRESRARVPPETIPLTRYIGLEHVESGTNRISGEGTTDDVKSTVAVFSSGDVLYGRLRPYLNKVILPSFDGVASTEFLVFNENDALSNQFLLHLLSSSDVVAYANAGSSGVNLPRVSGQKLGEYRLGLPPPPEQHRIAARIDSLVAKLDEAVAALTRAQANLDRYQASVLKAATRGRLTARWRSENPPGESGEELLRRILAERRKRWEEEQLAVFAAKGRKPPRNWKSKYKEPVAPDASRLSELPQGWCWATVDQVGQVIGGLTKNKARTELPTQYAYLRVANVYADELRLDDVRTIGVAESELERVLLRAGDLMVVEGNGSPGQIGRVAEWNGELTTCCHQNHLIKVRCDRGRACLPRWLLLWLLSPLGRRTVLEKASSTSGLYTLSLSKVRALPFPLAPYGEQIEAVKLADSLREAGRLARGRVQAGIHVQSAALRQSILKTAFEGRLVPQDPDDEPATVLLERIRCRGQLPNLAPAASDTSDTRRAAPDSAPVRWGRA